jgi:hypothetical protein
MALPCAFYTLGSDPEALFSAGGVRFVLGRGESEPPAPKFLALEFIGGRKDVEPVGEDPSGAPFSWFHATREQWKTGLPMYSRVVYPNLWPGIDLVYSGEGGRLEYSFNVAPGADPANIRLGYPEDATLARSPDGSLSIILAHGEDSSTVRDPNGGLAVMRDTVKLSLRDDPPHAFQEIDARRVDVPVSFETGAAGSPKQYGFQVGAHDPGRPLVIDPASFVYAGFLGSVDVDRGLGVAVDASGATYLTGQINTPTETAFTFDAYVAKIDLAGTSLVYYSLFAGSHEDEGFDIAVDADGNAYFTGGTLSEDYPVAVGPDLTSNGKADAFVTKLAPSGTDIVYSGFLGGTGVDYAEGIVVDGDGNAFVEGLVGSNQRSFPVIVGPDRSYNGGPFDTFIARIKAVPSSPVVTENLWYCGYIGGNDDDTGNGGTDGHVAIDSSGAAYVSGMTKSTERSFPTGRGFGSIPGFDHSQNGGFDAYVVKVQPDGGRLAYATYVGGAKDDMGFGMAVDAAGNAYFTGATESDEKSFPVTVGPDLTYNGGDSQSGDAFVVKLNASGTALVYCGYIGGSDCEKGEGVALDASGALVVVGYTESSEATLPVTGGPDLTFNGRGENTGDAFICKVKPMPSDPDPVKNFDYCGYIGGTGNDQAFWVALDHSGNAHVAGDTWSSETTFPGGTGMGNLPGWNQTHSALCDAFLVEIAP